MASPIIQVQVNPVGDHVLFLRMGLSSHAYRNATPASLNRLRRAVMRRLLRHQLELVWLDEFPFTTTFKPPIP